MSRAARRDWTARCKTAFLDALAATLDIAAAARAAGKSVAAACLLKQQDAEFGATWDAIVTTGEDRLRLALLQRALEGEPKPLVHQGKVVGEVLTFDNALALKLLAMAGVPERGALQESGGGDAARVRLAERLEALAAGEDAA